MPEVRREMERDLSFVEWLFAQAERDDEIGEWAAIAADDPEGFPIPLPTDNPERCVAYLIEDGLSEAEALALVRRMWEEWRATCPE